MDKIEIYHYLKRQNIAYEITEHKAVFNMEEADAVDLPYPEWGAKNLFVRDDKKRNYYLITMKGNKRVDLKAFRRQRGLRALSFAAAEELFDIMKLIPGAVTPLGILNDAEHRVQVFMDVEFVGNKIGVHPNDNTATVWMQADDLMKIIQKHEILWNTHVYNRKVLLKSLKKEKFTNKNGSHSALNIFTEYSMTDPGDLAEYFGFTEQEISALCEKYEMSFEEAKTWYDGYQLIAHRQTGDEIYSMYSPKSVVEAMLRHKFGTYWNQTETYEALKIYIQMDMDGLKDSVVRMLAGINYNKKTKKHECVIEVMQK